MLCDSKFSAPFCYYWGRCCIGTVFYNTVVVQDDVLARRQIVKAGASVSSLDNTCSNLEQSPPDGETRESQPWNVLESAFCSLGLECHSAPANYFVEPLHLNFFFDFFLSLVSSNATKAHISSDENQVRSSSEKYVQCLHSSTTSHFVLLMLPLRH